jgi:hypothetical protein
MTPRHDGRRGQAALEYLVTYGWGFLVILVVLGGMAYFGYLSPSRYTPERCNTGVQVECTDYQLFSTATGPGGHETIKVQFRNNLGDNINITHVYFFDDATGIPVDGTIVADSSIRRGNTSAIFTFDLGGASNVMPKGDKISVPVIVTFQRNETGAPEHNVTGEIYAVVR